MLGFDNRQLETQWPMLRYMRILVSGAGTGTDRGENAKEAA
jgi:hypothetical protein